MKRTILLLIFYVFYSCVHSQITDPKHKSVVNRNMALEVSAGYSMALGTYASSDKQDKKSGYATGGWQMQFTFDWTSKKNFGLAFQYTYQRNPMEHGVNVVYPSPGQIPDSLGPKSWSNHYLMVGPVFMTTIGRIHLDARILGGFIFSAGPAFDTPDPNDTTSFSFNKNIGTGFAYQISAGVGYTISPHVAFKFNLALLGGWPGKNRQYPSQLIDYETYKDPVTGLIYTRPVYSAPTEYEISKVVFTLNPSIGLVYRF